MKDIELSPGILMQNCEPSVYKTASRIIKHKGSINGNCFIVVVNSLQIAIWSYEYKNSINRWLLNICYLSQDGMSTYITPVENPENWMNNISPKALLIEYFDEHIIIEVDGPSAEFVSYATGAIMIPWPWWLWPYNPKTIDTAQIDDLFVKNTVETMYNFVFNPDICPFCIVKEAFGRKCDTNL